ncbi:MAG: MYXO-CTERM sorting domain-containing protein, partial [Myxococcota bacterium]|nr:MYXO-CTERM sorting domain-containing protein [Myxococcota bacterium]
DDNCNGVVDDADGGCDGDDDDDDDDDDSTPDDDDGCECATSAVGPPLSPAVLALLITALIAVRRRR